MHHPRHAAALFVLGLLLLVGSPWPAAAADCNPVFDARLDTQEPEDGMTNLQFKVKISGPEDCVRVIYDLVIEIVAPNGQVQLVRKMRDFELTGEEATDIVRHQVVAGSQVTSQTAKLVDCISCDAP